MNPEGILCVIPSRLGVGEEFSIKVKVLGQVRPIECHGAWNTEGPRLHGPFNLNVERNIQFLDNCLPEWNGILTVDGDESLVGPAEICFDGKNQGAFARDTRPIKTSPGFHWTKPGFHFVKLACTESGAECWANPVFVTPEPPDERIYWGDPHWQTFFSDGIRCPEELYAFARDEAFLDFGAIADHVEAVTDRQWDYFVAVTNDYNEPGRFVTLVGQEWTNHDPANSAPGHRNIYFRGDNGPVMRSTDPRYNTLDKLWKELDGLDAIAIPHHSANKVMGVDWSMGWNPRFEKAVEVYSVWGSSECHADDGNIMPIRHLGGEVRGRHVIDALKAGFKLGFVAGGDIHDGRPGDDLHVHNFQEKHELCYPQGFTAVQVPALTRERIYDAIKNRQTYATTKSRIYLDTEVTAEGHAWRFVVRAGSEQGIRECVIVRNGAEALRLMPEDDPRVVESSRDVEPLGKDEFCYVRVRTQMDNFAWSSPVWGGG